MKSVVITMLFGAAVLMVSFQNCSELSSQSKTDPTINKKNTNVRNMIAVDLIFGD